MSVFLWVLRVVVQPWHCLVSLNLSHNKLTHLDESLQVLPSLVEVSHTHLSLSLSLFHVLLLSFFPQLNVSHNLLMVVDLQHLCLPSLCTINLCHNNISKIEAYQLVLLPL